MFIKYFYENNIKFHDKFNIFMGKNCSTASDLGRLATKLPGINHT